MRRDKCNNCFRTPLELWWGHDKETKERKPVKFCRDCIVMQDIVPQDLHYEKYYNPPLKGDRVLRVDSI